ncbi:Protein of unknown function, partial [Gryllus bimaculatus]
RWRAGWLALGRRVRAWARCVRSDGAARRLAWRRFAHQSRPGAGRARPLPRGFCASSCTVCRQEQHRLGDGVVERQGAGSRVAVWSYLEPENSLEGLSALWSPVLATERLLTICCPQNM